MERDEDTLTAARRELKEETGLSCRTLYEVGAFSKPGRDPRGRVITIAYLTRYNRSCGTPQAGDDAKHLQWWPLNRLPKLAFDHREMIQLAKKRYLSSRR